MSEEEVRAFLESLDEFTPTVRPEPRAVKPPTHPRAPPLAPSPSPATRARPPATTPSLARARRQKTNAPPLTPPSPSSPSPSDPGRAHEPLPETLRHQGARREDHAAHLPGGAGASSRRSPRTRTSARRDAWRCRRGRSASRGYDPKDKRIAMTMEDVSAALGERGVDVRKPQYFEGSADEPEPGGRGKGGSRREEEAVIGDRSRAFGIIQLCYSSLVTPRRRRRRRGARRRSPLARRRLDLAGRLPLLELARVDGDVSADENDGGARVHAEDDGAALRLREGSGDRLLVLSVRGDSDAFARTRASYAASHAARGRGVIAPRARVWGRTAPMSYIFSAWMYACGARG